MIVASKNVSEATDPSLLRVKHAHRKEAIMTGMHLTLERKLVAMTVAVIAATVIASLPFGCGGSDSTQPQGFMAVTNMTLAV